MLEIRNHGPLILSTNYWDLPESKLGKVLVSCNAGAFRLLLPESYEPALADMATAKGVAVCRGPWPQGGVPDAFEFLFDDGTQDPYQFFTSPGAFDRLPAAIDVGHEWIVTAWTRPRRGKPHKALERPARYRLAASLPDGRPWEAR